MKRLLIFCFCVLPFVGMGQVVDTAAVGREVDSLIDVVSKYYKMGRLEDVLKISQSTLNLSITNFGEYCERTGKLLHNIAIVYSDLRQDSLAEVYFLYTLKIKKKVVGEMHIDYAISLNSLGILYKNTCKYEKAEQIYKEALYIKEKLGGKETMTYATSLSNLASLYVITGQYEIAEPMYMEALKIKKSISGNRDLSYASTLTNFSNLYFGMGEYLKSEYFISEAISIRSEKLGEGHPEYAKSLAGLARIKMEIGQFEDSESILLKSIAITEKAFNKQHPQYIQEINQLSVLYMRMHNYYKSKKLLLESIDILKKTQKKDNVLYATSMLNLGIIYSETGQFDMAENILLESQEIFKTLFSDSNPYYIQSIVPLALLYNQVGRYKDAEKILLIAINSTIKNLGKENTDYCTYVENLGISYWQTKRKNIAENIWKESSVIERQLLYKAISYLNEKELSDYIGSFKVKFYDYLSINIYSSKQSTILPEICYDNALFYKNFLLNVKEKLRLLYVKDSNSVNIYNRLSSLRFLLSKEYTKSFVERNQSVSQWESEANALEKELVRTVPSYSDALRPVSWQDVKANLHPAAAAIEFVDFNVTFPNPTDSTLYAALVLLPSDTAPHFIPLCEARQLDALLYPPNGMGLPATFFQNLYASSRADGKTPLYQLLWAPIDSLLRANGVKTVYFAASGLLHRLNLGAISEPGKSGKVLADRYDFTALGSTRQLALRPAVAPSPARPRDALIYAGVRYKMDSLAIANANAGMHVSATDTTGGLFRYANRSGERSNTFEYLPGTEKEARYLNGLLQKRNINTTLRLGYSATEESFKQIGRNGPSPALLHIGTHGFFFPDPKDTTHQRMRFGDDAPAFKISEHPLIRSGLMLAGSQYAWEQKHPMQGMEDGILTAYEVSQMNLSNTELVVLSACETGLGDIKGNEGVYGLQRAFRIAGAKNVLMSLWKVNDDVTEKLLTEFYKNWLERNMPLRNALEAAQAWMRAQEQYRNPYFWAGFVLVGE